MQDDNTNINTDMPNNDSLDELTKLQEKLTEMENNWKRALADYQNLQKRTAEEKLGYIDYANTTLIRKILPIMDNLLMLENHFEDHSLKMIIKEFENVLIEEGLVKVETQDQTFDPTTMEAIEIVDGPDNQVVDTIQNGYFLKNKLIRPARVKVGKTNSNQ